MNTVSETRMLYVLLSLAALAFSLDRRSGAHTSGGRTVFFAGAGIGWLWLVAATSLLQMAVPPGAAIWVLLGTMAAVAAILLVVTRSDPARYEGDWSLQRVAYLEGAPKSWTARPVASDLGTGNCTGDPVFDAVVHLGGNARAAHEALDASTREALRRFVEAGGSLVDGRLTLPLRRYRVSAAARAEVAERMVALATLLETTSPLAMMALRDPEPDVAARAAASVLAEPGSTGDLLAADLLEEALERQDQDSVTALLARGGRDALAAVRWLGEHGNAAAGRALAGVDLDEGVVAYARQRLQARHREAAGGLTVGETRGGLSEAAQAGRLAAARQVAGRPTG